MSALQFDQIVGAVIIGNLILISGVLAVVALAHIIDDWMGR